MKKYNDARPTYTEEEINGLKAIMEEQKRQSEAWKKEREAEAAGLKAIRQAQLKAQGRI